MKNKVEKEPFFSFYIKFPFFRIMSTFGWWECSECGKFYSPRVIRYGLLHTRCSKCKKQ